MADASVAALPSALASMTALPGGKADPTAATATPASAAAADPFAAMLAAAVAPTALPTPPLPSPVGLTLPAEPSVAATGERPAAKDQDATDGTADPADPLAGALADAISAGPIAVLTLSPTVAANPAPTPVKTAGTPARVTLAAITARAPRLPVEQRAAQPDQPTALPAEMPEAAVATTVTTPDAKPSQPGPTKQEATKQDAAAPASVAAAKPAEVAKATAPTPPIADAIVQASAAAVPSTAPQAAPSRPADPKTGDVTAAAAPALSKTAAAEQAKSVTRASTDHAPTDTAPATRRADPRRRSAEQAPELAATPNMPGRAAPLTGSAPQTAGPDKVVAQTLSVAQDGAWLDTLARDIAASADSNGTLQFKLNPEHLGALAVAISQGADGASVRLTADTESTRSLLVDAQPRLVAEAQAQGLKIGETHVELSQNGGQNGNADRNGATPQDGGRWQQQGASGQQANAQTDQQRQSSTAHQPFVSTTGRTADREIESSAADPDALYA